jgi:hypothetical protein
LPPVGWCPRLLNEVLTCGRSRSGPPLRCPLRRAFWFPQELALHYAYVHESGDERSLALAAVLIPVLEGNWLRVLDHLLGWRRDLHRGYGLHTEVDIRASELLQGSGPWRDLKLSPAVRLAVFRQGLEQLHQLAPGPHATAAGVRAFAVVLPDRHDARITDGTPEEAWEVLLERLRSFSEAEGSDVQLWISSMTPLTARRIARQSRRKGLVPSAYATGWLSRPFTRLIEDPVVKTTQSSYPLQLSGLVAYTALRTVVPVGTSRLPRWTWLGNSVLRAVNYLERRERGSQEPPGLVVWPDRNLPT